MQFPSLNISVIPGNMWRISTEPEVCEITVEYRMMGRQAMICTYRGAGFEWKNQHGKVVTDIIAALLCGAYMQFSAQPARERELVTSH